MRLVTLQETHALIGQEFGVSDWFEVSQDRINDFAEVTVDIEGEDTPALAAQWLGMQVI